MGETRGDQVQRIILRTLAKRGWKLVRDEAGFIDEVCAQIGPRETIEAVAFREPRVVERATIRHYCVVLYNACREAGSQRQQTAFEELWRYLYPMALYKTHEPNLAQDLAQQALIKVWEKLGQCRDPGSFLNYAALILINETRDYYRRVGRRGDLAAESAEPGSETLETELEHSSARAPGFELEQLPDETGETGLDQVMDDESHREVAQIIQACVKNRRQQTVLIRLFLDDKGYKEIADELGITVGNVHVLRHRALAALRKCEAFMHFLEDRLS